MTHIIKEERDLKFIYTKIKDGSSFAVSGFNLSTSPEYLLLKLFETYEETGHPKDLFLISDSSPGSPGRGLDIIAKSMYDTGDFGFLSGILSPFLAFTPWMEKIVRENKIEGYTASIGTVAHWLREISASRPGLITRVGLGTFLDPRESGSNLNDLANKKRRVSQEIITIDGQEFIFFKGPQPDFALIRGTTADEIGNMSMEKEGIYGSIFPMAQAAKALPNRGIVFSQVERIAKFGTMNPKAAHVPGPLIDYVVVSPEMYSWQGGNLEFNPGISGTIIPPDPPKREPSGDLTFRDVIIRRTAQEVAGVISEKKGPIIVNFGVGMPAEVPMVLNDEGLKDYVYSTVEAGPWGGVPLQGSDFGLSMGPFAIIPLPDQFTLYEGGMIDLAVLGFMEVDPYGNVNPSSLPNKITGPGGFPVIVSGSPRIIFSGAFTSGKPDIKVTMDGLKIVRDGGKKFVKDPYKILFSTKQMNGRKKEVTYITERAVFKLISGNLTLVEVAPGVDIEKDIMNMMEFRPNVSKAINEMDRAIFLNWRLGLSKKGPRHQQKI